MTSPCRKDRSNRQSGTADGRPCPSPSSQASLHPHGRVSHIATRTGPGRE
eukprot:CAMPEP_0175903248 /NCGR_PEP_ID=MMETSP0108-20121206/3830_1 /TAXON_ID=195067 ORGANISM="Goniomonas pacifica, Strain CCMP1869" /NCGR_SAMPLE_ID=MMETSP0108 /ASSEMBLY_ACC=CAM_ASM_000204 /LENGTH=49 /DNA_ID=CAMNT_0017224957 /DNA_START=118 /DNA_END=267 /DNA_ORIENTATION=+